MELKNIVEWSFTVIQTELITALSFWFVLGLLIFALGAFALGIMLLYCIKGRNVEGKLIGAVKQTRIKKKKRDGKIVEKVKEKIYPIFEYTRLDGSIYQEIGSSNINPSTDKYQTGQSVNLRVMEHKHYDDLIDADKKTGLYVGLIMLTIGASLMSLMLTEFGLNITFWLNVSFILSLGLYKLVSLFLSPRNKEEDPRPPIKRYAVEDIKPIEEFYEERPKAKD